MEPSVRQKSEIAQLKCQLRATELDFVISIPTTEVSFDLILSKNGQNFKSQIKYCNRVRSNGSGNLELRLDDKDSNRLYYTDAEIDRLLVFVSKLDKVLIYTKRYFHKKKSLTINITDKNSPYYWQKFVW